MQTNMMNCSMPAPSPTNPSRTPAFRCRPARLCATVLTGVGLLSLGIPPAARAMPYAIPTHELPTLMQDKPTDKQDDKKPDKANPFSAEEQKLKDHAWGVVVANQHGVLAVPVAAGGLSPVQRARMVAARMGKLYQAGVHFRDPKNYVVGKFNGQVVLAMRVADSAEAPTKHTDSTEQDKESLVLLFTIDTNLAQYLAQGKGTKSLSREDIAYGWCGMLIKALKEDTDIGVSMGGSAKQTKHEWANVSAGSARGQVPVPLRASQVRRSAP